MHAVQYLSFRKVRHAVEPSGSARDGGGRLLCFRGYRIFFLDKEWYYMRIDLRHDEMVDIEHLGKTSHGDIVVDGTINPALWRGIPRYSFAGLWVFGK